MTALGVLCGAGIGLGVLLVIAGWRGARLSSHVVTRRQIEGQFLRISIATGVGILVLAVTGWLVAGILAGGFTFVARRLFGGKVRQRASIERTEAVAAWAEMLRDTMAGAAGIEQAIEATAHAAPEPIREEVRALARRLERQSLSSALRAFADDVQHPTADLVVAALTLASQKHAKRVGELLGSLAIAARQDATMRLRVDAGRARTRTSTRVVVGATVGMAAGMLLLNRSYLEPYGSAAGQFMLAVVGGLFTAAFIWLDRMAQAGTPARILSQNEAAR